MMDDNLDFTSDTDLKFGISQFSGPPSTLKELKRWLVQFLTLFNKNLIILSRRWVSLLIFLVLPSLTMLVFLMETENGSSSSTDMNLPPIPISGLGSCNTYASDCIRLVYSPNSNSVVNEVITSFTANNELILGQDVLGFATTDAARSFVANNLGKVQYTLFFRDEALWYPNPDYGSDSKNIINRRLENVSVPSIFSYVAFYNDTIDDKDTRSKQYDLDYPLLVLQKEIEMAYQQVSFHDDFLAYDAEYGQFWSQPQGGRDGINATANSTMCDVTKYGNMGPLSQTLMWVFVFVFLFTATIPFNLVGDERRKTLFGFLRRLGLMDSAYWASWFLIFQILLLVACAIAMVVAAFVRPHSKALNAIDLDLLFLIFWMTGTAFVALALAMAAFSSSASMNTAIYSAEFLIALVTVASCSPILCQYEYILPLASDGDVSIYPIPECHLIASSYNTIYSEQLLGYEFVQFLVFFLPWYYAAQALSNALSIAQYEGRTIGTSNMSDKVSMSYSAQGINLFSSPWIGYSLLLLFS